MLYLIQNQDLIINSDHIISAEYTPPEVIPDGTDGNPGRTTAATLEIMTTELALEEDVGYDGTVNGVTAVSHTVKLYDTNATRLWEVLVKSAYPI